MSDRKPEPITAASGESEDERPADQPEPTAREAQDKPIREETPHSGGFEPTPYIRQRHGSGGVKSSPPRSTM